MVTDSDAQVKDFYWGDEALGDENSASLVNTISNSSRLCSSHTDTDYRFLVTDQSDYIDICLTR